MNFLETLNFEQLTELKSEVDYYFEKAKRNDTISIIDEFSNMDKREIKIIVKKYNQQLVNVRNNKEYDELDKKIKIANALLTL
jgi:molybdopterin converting factor small subunit